MAMLSGGSADWTKVKVWNTSTLDFEWMSQTVVNTGELTVSGTTDLTKIGGVAVGAANALHVQPGTGAIFSTTDDNKAQVIYEDGDDLYVCKATIGSARASAVWQIKKVVTVDPITITWCDGNANYDQAATSLAIVKTYTYG